MPFVPLVQKIFALLKLVATGFSCHLHPQESRLLQHPNQGIIFYPFSNNLGLNLGSKHSYPSSYPTQSPQHPPLLSHQSPKKGFTWVSRQPRAGGPPPREVGDCMIEGGAGRETQMVSWLREKENPHQHWLADCI